MPDYNGNCIVFQSGDSFYRRNRDGFCCNDVADIIGFLSDDNRIFSGIIWRTEGKGFTWLPILLYFLYVNVVVLLCGFFFGWFQFESIKMIAIAEFTIGIVFFTVAAVTYLTDCRTADRINRRLRERTREENSEME